MKQLTIIPAYNESQNIKKVLDELKNDFPETDILVINDSSTDNTKEIVVSNAIAYLIYTNKLNAQIYGYIFDSDDNLILEGEHFGHTEREARLKLKEQRDSYERKFQF